ncbi:MAG TPA: hypothetical protein DEA71_15725 [Nitrospira sp.]|nr:hypothetical protein [Nitrospira sp.]
MKVRRDVASVPVRSASETWRVIVELVTNTDSVDKQQLDSAASIMESLIADEMPARVPITFKGSGVRVVVYCLYNEDAKAQGLDIDKLHINPTAGDWSATAPCEAEDVAWMNKSLITRAPRIVVHDIDVTPADADDQPSARGLEIDWGALSTK